MSFFSDLSEDPVAPFCFLMDASMLGVGVGFDTKGEGTIDVLAPGSAESLNLENTQVGILAYHSVAILA